MAEYINKEDLKFLEIPIAPVIQGEQVHYEQGFLKEWLENVPTADAIERSEYEKLRFVNLDLAETNKGLLAEHKQLLELRSKVDKAIEEMESNLVGLDTWDIEEKREYYTIKECIEVLKENIGE